MDFAGRERLANRLAALARANIWIGTSSWKYPGWCGTIYDEQRYIWKGRFRRETFENACLEEYAQTFKTVCVDAAYYKFPERDYLRSLFSQAPQDFLFTFKVTDEITVKRFNNLPRYGLRAGRLNENFLNAEVFIRDFLKPFEQYRTRIGLLVFEFSKFYPADFEQGKDFAVALGRFLSQLPAGWPYGVEIRNRHFLRPAYFEMLTNHGVTHVYNSWADMPPVSEQLSMAGSITNPKLVAARFLLKPGRKYEAAVALFQPYKAVKEPCPNERQAGARLVQDGLADKTRRTFIYVNNRLEGHSPATIAAMLERAGIDGSATAR